MEFQDQDLIRRTQQCLTEAEEVKQKEYIFGIGDKKQGLVIKNVIEYIFKKQVKVYEHDEPVGASSEGVVNLVPKPELFVKVVVVG